MESHSWPLIKKLLEKFNCSDITRFIITEAYHASWRGQPFEDSSDGISWIISFDDDYGIKHPVGVGHDFLYRAGPSYKSIDRKWADVWFKNALTQFGHEYRAQYQYVGLRLFGFSAWNAWRKQQAEIDKFLQWKGKR